MDALEGNEKHDQQQEQALERITETMDLLQQNLADREAELAQAYEKIRMYEQMQMQSGLTTMHSSTQDQAHSREMEKLRESLEEKELVIGSLSTQNEELHQTVKAQQQQIESLMQREAVCPPAPAHTHAKLHIMTNILKNEKVAVHDCFDCDSPHRPRSSSTNTFWQTQFHEAIHMRKQKQTTPQNKQTTSTRKPKKNIFASPRHSVRGSMDHDEKLPLRSRYFGMNHRQESLAKEIYRVFS